MMNPGGPAEEVGKATNAFMQIMKDQPLSLALVVMNVLLLGIFFYVIQLATKTRGEEMDRIFKSQSEMSKLLYNCVPADKRGEMKLQSDESHPAELATPQ